GLGIEFQTTEERGIDRNRANGVDQNGVAIGRRIDDDLRADIAGTAGLVLYDDALTPHLAEGVANLTRQNIGSATGGERHDRGDGFGGPVRSGAGSAAKQSRTGNSRAKDTQTAANTCCRPV